MKRIITVLGDIPPDDLGFASMHEHTISDPSVLKSILLRSMPFLIKGIMGYGGGADLKAERQRRNLEKIELPEASISGVIGSMKMPRSNPASKLDNITYYVNELKAFKENGGNAICDCSPNPGFGINPSDIQTISRMSGVHIVTAAGYYIRSSIPKKDFRKGENWMQKKIEHYLDFGDGKCSARPGFVKCAISSINDKGLCPQEFAAVRACALAAKSHGMCLHIHTQFPVRKQIILDLASHLEHVIGLSPERIVFCHMDSYNIGSGNPCAFVNTMGYDLELPLELLKRGFNIGIDTWSFASGTTKEAKFNLNVRKQMLKDLIALGYADRITLGHDMMSRSGGIQNQGSGYVFWPLTLKAMVENGELSQEDLDKMTIENPRRLLTVS